MGKNLGKIIEKCYHCSVVIMDSMHMVGVHLILGSTLPSDRNTFDGANTDSWQLYQCFDTHSCSNYLNVHQYFFITCFCHQFTLNFFKWSISWIILQSISTLQLKHIRRNWYLDSCFSYQVLSRLIWMFAKIQLTNLNAHLYKLANFKIYLRSNRNNYDRRNPYRRPSALGVPSKHRYTGRYMFLVL